jgi:hypothetical protein
MMRHRKDQMDVVEWRLGYACLGTASGYTNQQWTECEDEYIVFEANRVVNSLQLKRGRSSLVLCLLVS